MSRRLTRAPRRLTMHMPRSWPMRGRRSLTTACHALVRLGQPSIAGCVGLTWKLVTLYLTVPPPVDTTSTP